MCNEQKYVEIYYSKIVNKESGIFLNIDWLTLGDSIMVYYLYNSYYS